MKPKSLNLLQPPLVRRYLSTIPYLAAGELRISGACSTAPSGAHLSTLNTRRTQVAAQNTPEAESPSGRIRSFLLHTGNEAQSF